MISELVIDLRSEDLDIKIEDIVKWDESRPTPLLFQGIVSFFAVTPILGLR